MKRIRLFPAVLVVAASLVIGGCKPRQLNEQQARELLGQVQRARRDTNVSGTVTTTIRMGNEIVTAEAKIHRGAGRMQLELISGRGKGFRIISQGDRVWQIGPDGQTVRRLPFNPVDAGPPLHRPGAVQMQAGEVVAGRQTDRVTVRPSTQSAVRMELLVDRQTRFPLATWRYNESNKLVSGSKYLTADFSVEPPEPIRSPVAAGDEKRRIGEQVDAAKATEVLGTPPLEPDYVPEGFSKVGYFLHQRQRGSAVEIRYSDGVRSLSVIEFKAPEGARTPRGPAGREQGSVRGNDGRPADRQAGTEDRRDAQQHSREVPPSLRRAWQKLTPEQRRTRTEQWRRSTPEQRREMLDRLPGQREEASAQPHTGPKGDVAGAEAGQQEHRPRHADGRRGRDTEMGRSRIRGNVVRFWVGSLGVVIAGEAPHKELRMMADSIKQKGGDS